MPQITGVADGRLDGRGGAVTSSSWPQDFEPPAGPILIQRQLWPLQCAALSQEMPGQTLPLLLEGHRVSRNVDDIV